MSETETPTEHLHEHINEEAEHSKEKWMVWVALSTAVIAVLAAVASLLANHHSDEALLTQIQSSDNWSFYEAKGVKSNILISTNEILTALGKEKIQKDADKVEENKAEQAKIMKEAQELAEESKHHVSVHQTLARSVTFFQIAIAISAITILTKRKLLWIFSLALSVAGIYFLLAGSIF